MARRHTKATKLTSRMTTLALVKAQNCAGVSGGVKGAILAFISTLDAAAYTFTFELGTELRVVG